MGLNEDLGDRENVGSAAMATQRAREQREREIQEKREEVELVNAYIKSSIAIDKAIGECDSDHDTVVFKRILAVLESQLETLTRGMKGV